MVRFTVAPGFAAPPQLHHHVADDVLMIVLAGRLAVTGTDGEATAGPGEVVVLRHGTPFAWRNARADDEAVYLGVYAPGGFEQYFPAVQQAAAEAGGLSPEVVAPLAAVRHRDQRQLRRATADGRAGRAGTAACSGCEAPRVVLPDAFRDVPVLTGERVRLEPLTPRRSRTTCSGSRPRGPAPTGSHAQFDRDTVECWLRDRADPVDRADWAVVRRDDRTARRGPDPCLDARPSRRTRRASSVSCDCALSGRG